MCHCLFNALCKNASVSRAANLGRSALVLFQLWDVTCEMVEGLLAVYSRASGAYEWHNGCGFIHGEFQALMAKIF
jgi:hypothetical protein